MDFRCQFPQVAYFVSIVHKGLCELQLTFSSCLLVPYQPSDWNWSALANSPFWTKSNRLVYRGPFVSSIPFVIFTHSFVHWNFSVPFHLSSVLIALLSNVFQVPRVSFCRHRNNSPHWGRSGSQAFLHCCFCLSFLFIFPGFQRSQLHLRITVCVILRFVAFAFVWCSPNRHTFSKARHFWNALQIYIKNRKVVHKNILFNMTLTLCAHHIFLC